MCVMPFPAEVNDTYVVTYVTYDPIRRQPVHYTFYQNRVSSLQPGGNFMFLHFPTAELEQVEGPDNTHNFLPDITRNLRTLEPVIKFRTQTMAGEMSRGGLDEPVIWEQGDYSIVVCNNPNLIIDALDGVSADRRPTAPEQLADIRRFAAFFSEWCPDWSFALPCFDGSANPTHPISVRYVPHNDDLVFAPGLDGHDGKLPVIGQDIVRDFRVGFAVQGHQLPVSFRYSDPVFGPVEWMPDPHMGVAGFHDNRHRAPNGDYNAPLLALLNGLSGPDLLNQLVPTAA